MPDVVGFSVVVRLSLLSAVAFQVLLATCPTGWVSWRDSCYIFLPEKMSWHQAVTACDRASVGHLAVPNTPEELDVLLDMDKHWGPSLWIGCKFDSSYLDLSQVACVDDGRLLVPINVGPWGNNPRIDCAKLRMGQDDVVQASRGVCDRNKTAICEMPDPSRRFCMSSDRSGRFTPQCLLDHGLKNLTTMGLIDCGEACWAEPRCHSFNLWQRSGPRKTCQLNQATRQGAVFKQIQHCSFLAL